MGAFNTVASDVFDKLQLEAGMLLKEFDPDSPTVPTDANIICATTGGINATCVPTTSDYGEDIDNVPANTKELLHIDSWECKFAFTALDMTADMIKLALSAATKTAATSSTAAKIVPNAQPDPDNDFTDLWWVGEIADGGLAAIKLANAFSTGGFNLQTGKASKGQLSVELTGYVSIEDTDEIPMEFYIGDAPTGETGETGA